MLKGTSGPSGPTPLPKQNYLVQEAWDSFQTFFKTTLRKYEDWDFKRPDKEAKEWLRIQLISLHFCRSAFRNQTTLQYQINRVLKKIVGKILHTVSRDLTNCHKTSWQIELLQDASTPSVCLTIISAMLHDWIIAMLGIEIQRNSFPTWRIFCFPAQGGFFFFCYPGQGGLLVFHSYSYQPY